MDFDKQLQNAIERGKNRGDAEAEAERERTLSAEELRNRHTEFRLKLSEHIEKGMQKLCEHFPGFEQETIYGEKGWGSGLAREDLKRGGPFYSRIEIVVRPVNEFNVVNIIGKGTINNKEVLNWNYFEDIPKSDLKEFEDRIDGWILTYAEKFAAS
jgi:hypothetical protein